MLTAGMTISRWCATTKGWNCWLSLRAFWKIFNCWLTKGTCYWLGFMVVIEVGFTLELSLSLQDRIHHYCRSWKWEEDRDRKILDDETGRWTRNVQWNAEDEFILGPLTFSVLALTSSESGPRTWFSKFEAKLHASESAKELQMQVLSRDVIRLDTLVYNEIRGEFDVSIGKGSGNPLTVL